MPPPRAAERKRYGSRSQSPGKVAMECPAQDSSGASDAMKIPKDGQGHIFATHGREHNTTRLHHACAPSRPGKAPCQTRRLHYAIPNCVLPGLFAGGPSEKKCARDEDPLDTTRSDLPGRPRLQGRKRVTRAPWGRDAQRRYGYEQGLVAPHELVSRCCGARQQGAQVFYTGMCCV